MIDRRPKPFALSRRAALGGFASATALAASWPEPATAATPGPGVCVISPEAVEGPFYYDPALVRSDITEGRGGVPVELALMLIDAAGCTPIERVRVDVWHADARGDYSGFSDASGDEPASAKRAAFMRGTQFSDAAGAVTFRTVYPGWYRGRTPHIHLKAFLDDRNVLTTQLYFPDGLSEYIYEKVAAYGGRAGARDTTNTTDGVLADTTNGRSAFLAVREESDRYVATITIAVSRSAVSRPDPRRGPPPGPPPAQGGERRGPPPGPPPEGMGERPRPSGPLVPGGA